MADIAGDRISYKIDINGLSQLDGMKRTIQQIEKSMPGLSKSIRSAQEAMKKLNKETSNNHATDEIKRQTRNYDTQKHSVDNVYESVSRTNRATEKLGKTMTRVGNGNHFTKQSRDLGSLGSKMQSFGKRASVATAAIGVAAGAAVKQAMGLQNRYKVINNLAVTGGEKSAEAQKNVNAMQKQAITLSDRYGVSQKQLASGYEILVRRGYTTNQALGAQKSYLQGAIASGDSYTDVVNGAASAIEQFGMRVKSVQGMAQASKTAINQMAYSADMTATSFSDMSEALKYAGPDAHAAHQSLHTTVSAIGQVSNAGIDGSQAGTSLRQIYQRLENPPTKGKAPNALKELGLSSKDFLDAHKNLIPIQDVFEKLDSRMKGMSRTQKGAIYSALFGADASSVAQTLGSSYKQMDALDKKVQNAQNMNHGQGYVAELSKKNMKSLQNQWNVVQTQAKNAGIGIANAWLPSLAKIAKSVASVLTQFNKLPEPAKKFAGAAVAAVALTGPLALIAGSLIRTAAAMKTITSLSGGKGATNGLLGNAMGFLGVGGKPTVDGKSMPKIGSRLKNYAGKGNFKTQARVPGSWIMNGVHPIQAMRKASTWVDNTAIGRRTATVRHAPRNLASTLWSDTKTIAGGGLSKARNGLSRAGGLIRRIPGVSKLGSIAKVGGKIASRVPVLDIAMAGTNMIGMNSKNAGKKVGSAGGMLAGGAIGSMFGPLGGMAGAAIGQTLGAKFGAAIQKTIPKKIQTSLSKSIKSMGKTVKGLLTPFKSVSRSIGRTWSSATKGISKSWNKYVVKPLTGKAGGAAIKGAMKVFKAVLIPALKVAGAAFKLFGTVVKTAIKVVAHVIEGLIKTVSGVVSLVSDVIHGRWKNIWKDAVQIFTGVFGTIGNVMKDILDGVMDTIKSFGKNIGSFLKHPVKSVEGWFGGGTKHAAGTTHLPYMGAGIRTNEHAIVNDGGGREMVVYPNGQAVIPNGRNVHMMLPKGTNVFNAADTRRMVHHASGTTKLDKKPKIDTLSKESKQTSKSMKSINKAIENGYSKSNKGSKKQLNQIKKNSTNTFKNLNRDTKKQTQKIQTNTVGDFDDMQKGSATQMKQMYKGVKAYVKDIDNNFQDGMNKLPVYAQSAMSKTISALNRGFRSINTVLSQFGGNNATLNLAHYATGSKGPISGDQLAVVNDAPTGPHQEAIIRGSNVMFPKGRNVVTKLQKGDEVLNGSETQQMFGSLPHFAKGTDALKRIITDNSKNPDKAFSKDFDAKINLRVMDTDLAKDLGLVGSKAVDSLGTKWYQTVWSVLNDAMSSDDGTASINGAALVKAVYKYGHGKPYVWGATGPNSFDCSGLVQYALKHAFGINYPRVSGAQINYAHRISAANAKPGDLIGNSGHIGVYMGGGKYYSAQSPDNHPNIGVSDVKYFPHGPHYFGRVSGATIANSDAKKKSSKDSGLTKLVKKELSSQIKWVGKNLADDFGDLGGFTSTGGNAITKAMIAKAEKVMKVPESVRAKVASDILRMAVSESGNRNIGQTISDSNSASGNPAGGPLQYVRSTFLNYAVPGHKNWSSPYDQVLAYLNNSQYKNATGMTTIWGNRKFDWLGSGPHGSRRFANGGWAENGKVNIFGEAPGENEVAINTHRPSADPLLVEAMSDRASQKPNGVFAQFKSYLKMQREMKKMKSSQKEFNQNTQRATNPQHGMTLKPQLIYNPQITINGATDAQDTSKKLSAELVKDRSQFASMMNDFCNMILVSQQ